MARLVINGEEREILSDPQLPLLWVLRDELGYSSPKYGCGLEQCGACRVLLDGVPAASCRIPLSDVDGQSVSTLEWLVRQPTGKMVVDALVAENAGQCGYCLPGIAVTLTALVDQERVSWTDAIRALDDHLCRCGSQPRILKVARELLASRTQET